MVKNWIFYLLGLAGTLAFHAYYFGWFSWFVLQLMVLLPMLSFLVSLPAMLRTRLMVQVQNACQQHEAAYVQLQTDGGMMPVPQCRFRLRVEHRMTGQNEVLRQYAVGREIWYVKLNTEHVGALRCYAEKARVYDYLKLFRIPVRVCPAAQILVKPKAEQPLVLPNLTRFLTQQLRPKPGGGFSEEHEMRTYQPGDPMRSVHWKLSAKIDDLIVREAQEPVRGKVLLTMDLAGTPEQLDNMMSRFLWLSRWLLEHDTPHSLAWIDPGDYSTVSVEITSEQTLQELLERLLQTSMRPDTPSVSHRQFPGVQWRHHIAPEREVAS